MASERSRRRIGYLGPWRQGSGHAAPHDRLRQTVTDRIGHAQLPRSLSLHAVWICELAAERPPPSAWLGRPVPGSHGSGGLGEL
jgi:hypothetical protein